MSLLDIIKRTLSEAEGGGTSIEGKKSLENQKKRAQILLKSADLRLKQQKEREALARQKSALGEESETDLCPDCNENPCVCVQEEKKMKGEDPCWAGYEMVGKKIKNGKEVPNCVPKEGVKEEFEIYEAKVGDTVSFHHELKAAPGKKVKKSGTVEKVEGDVVHVKVKDKYGVMRHQVKSSDLVKEEIELDESSKYQIYHPSYSSAVQHALSQVEKQGFKVDMEDYERKVAFGPKKPSVGKTNSFSITLMDKNGKISKKALHMQVYGMEGGKYELNMYTEEVVAEGQMHTAPETVKHYFKGEKTKTGIEKWLATTIDKKKKEIKESESILEGSGPKEKQKTPYRDINSPEYRAAAEKRKQKMADDKAAEPGKKLLSKMKKEGVEEFKQGGKPLEKKFNKAFKAMGVDAKIKMKTVNNISINEEEKPKKSYKDMKKKKENTSDKDVKQGEKLSGKQEPIDLNPTVDNNK